MILKVSALGYLQHLTFVSIGPLGPHDAGCTLELKLQPHWLELEMLMEDGPGAENISQLQLGMWLVEFPAQGDHAPPFPILTGWLTRLIEL